MRKIGYVAVDDGPKRALLGLASGLKGEWLKADATEAPGWMEVLRAQRVELLICGTSDTARGRAVEGGARAAASALGIPIVVVEDFPGSFAGVPGGNPRLLCVESEFAARLAQRKVDGELAVHIGPAIRYDALRRELNSLRRSFGGETANTVLWIGQPETEDALRTLAAVIPALEERWTLWFRAHPRDEGYRSGAYGDLFNASRRSIEDMTARSLDHCLRRRPRLVMTQFSSAAVEAGFWGIPALNVLLPDAGGARLLEKKGYAVPPWCDAGASFLVTSTPELADMLERVMSSERARAEVKERFDAYFKVHEEGSQGLINVLYNQGLL